MLLNDRDKKTNLSGSKYECFFDVWKHWTVSGHAEETEEYSQLHLDTLGTGSVGMPWWGGEQGFIPTATGGRWGFPQSSTRGVMYTAINQAGFGLLEGLLSRYLHQLVAVLTFYSLFKSCYHLVSL